MTRKDFELIARVVSQQPGLSVRLQLGTRFANELARTNPRFNRDRFLNACCPVEGGEQEAS